MKKQTTYDPGGDDPIGLGEYQFTRPEVAYLARLPVQSVINWMGRGHVGMLGRKDRRTGRWLFSLDDVLRLSVMFDFCARKALLLPAEAAQVAEIVVIAARDSTEPGANTSGTRPNINVVVSWQADGQMVVNTYNIRSPAYYPPRGSEDPDDYQPLRRGHLVIPATAMLIDAGLRTQHLHRCKEAADG